MRVAGWLLFACALSAQTVTVTGSVTNAITHEPVEGVRVVLFPISRSSSAKSDASGRFRIPNVKPGGYRLEPSMQGFDGVAMEIRIEAGVDPRPFDLTMVPWPRLRGTVFDPERRPVARVRVRAISSNSAHGVVHEVTTDATGRFILERLAPGQYHVLATLPLTGNPAGPMDLAPTWFHGVLDQRDALLVSLAPG